MIDREREWREFFEWLREASQPLAAPKCPRHRLLGWLAEMTQEDCNETHAALMHWLQHWQWPPMNEEARGLAWVMMSFAWSWLIDGMDRGWVVPATEAQRRGVIHGLLFREWERDGLVWCEAFVKSSKRGIDGSHLN